MPEKLEMIKKYIEIFYYINNLETNEDDTQYKKMINQAILAYDNPYTPSILRDPNGKIPVSLEWSSEALSVEICDKLPINAITGGL
jgi:hypothetical protein